MALLESFLSEILRCPACKGDLVEDAANMRLCCSQCHLGYPVKDGVPVMLIDQASPCDEDT